MRLSALELNEFRNFQRLRLELRPRVNFLHGENGQGKTNLLEAVYLLCRGSSFRAASARNFLRERASDGPVERARIAGHFIRAGLEFDVAMLIDQNKKAASINGKRVNAASLMAHFPVVLFSPESLSAIKEGPEQRRQLIDEILINHDPKQGQLLREFSRALKARNRLLKNLADGLGSRDGQIESLESLDKIYFLLATHLTKARLEALKDLQPEICRAMSSISDGSDADISVDYVISDQSALQWSEAEVFDALHKRHRQLATQELAFGASLVGPHKHDIKLLFSGKDSRFYCSQGQQRALILALKIAQIVYHYRVHQTYPVLLLDDVMSELDAKKRVNLMKFLERISAQILITATDLTWPDYFGLERSSIFSVTEGRISQVNG